MLRFPTVVDFMGRWLQHRMFVCVCVYIQYLMDNCLWNMHVCVYMCFYICMGSHTDCFAIHWIYYRNHVSGYIYIYIIMPSCED